MKSFEERLKEKASERRKALSEEQRAPRRSVAAPKPATRATVQERSVQRSAERSVEPMAAAAREGQSATSKDQGTSKKDASKMPKLSRSLKVTVFILLFVFTMSVGAMIGYGVFGDRPAFEVFNPQTWKHMLDLVFASGK